MLTAQVNKIQSQTDYFPDNDNKTLQNVRTGCYPKINPINTDKACKSVENIARNAKI